MRRRGAPFGRTPAPLRDAAGCKFPPSMLHENPMNTVEPSTAEPRYAALAEKSLDGKLLSPGEMESVQIGRAHV